MPNENDNTPSGTQPSRDDPGANKSLPTAAAELRHRLAKELAAGETIALSGPELADPAVRQLLPSILEELDASRTGAADGPDLPGYTVLGEIGHGGMSTVYLARDNQLTRYVALKQLRRGPGESSRTRERAMCEARALARLSHQHIVTVYEVVEQGSDLVIVMEWVDGVTLSQLLATMPREPSPQDMALIRATLGGDGEEQQLESNAARTFAHLIRDIALAAECAHDEGLLHLDIKPSNILVRRNGTALLVDFGVVRERDLDLTHTQSFAGTPVYAAPEQLRRDDTAIGPATDVYGLGITLYELLARTRPLGDDGLTLMLRRIESGRIPRLSSLTHVAHDLENIVHKAIAIEPASRYPTAKAMAADLTAFLEGMPVAAHPESQLQRLRRWTRAEPWKAILIAVVLVTAPIMLGLGTTLLLERERILEGRARDDRLEARMHIQAALQLLVARREATEEGRGRLQQAQLLVEDSENLFAARIAYLGDDPWDEGLALAASLPAARRGSVGVSLLEQRLQERRPFWTQQEATTVLSSGSSQDLMLLALDRIMRHLDSRVEEDLEMARQALDQRRWTHGETDPVTIGLLCWVAGMLADEELITETSTTIESVWPDNIAAQVWRIFGKGLSNAARGVRIGNELLDEHPDSQRIATAVVSFLLKLRKDEEALAMMQRMTPAPERQLYHDAMLANLHARLGHEDKARQLLEEQSGRDQDHANLNLSTLTILDPDAAREEYLAQFARGEASMLVLLDAFDLAYGRRDFQLLQALVEHGKTHFPHHAGYHRVSAIYHTNSRPKDYRQAADHFEAAGLPRYLVDEIGHLQASTFCLAKDWSALRLVAERWQRYGSKDPARVNLYLGIAYSRTGEPQRALECLDRYLELVPSGPNRRSDSVFERLWLLVSPSSPATLRRPEAAVTSNFASLVAWARAKHAPWALAVLAEVMFANGDTEPAIRLAEEALLCADQPRETDPEQLEQRIEAALQRYRKP